MATEPIVLFEVRDAIARITLNRPEKRNALNEELISALKEALRRANQDENIRVAVLSGGGSDFCAGADLSALQKIANGSVQENLIDARSLMELFTLIRKVRMPVIAAVRGRALAGGCGLALACDVVLAEQSARFGFPEVKIGFVPAMVMAILRRNVSEKKAFELTALGDDIGADEAEDLGLINHVFADAEFEMQVETFARRFEKLSRSAISLSKTLLYHTYGVPFVEALESGADLNVIARMSEDCRAGVERFLLKQRKSR